MLQRSTHQSVSAAVSTRTHRPFRLLRLLRHVAIGVFATILLGMFCARLRWHERYNVWTVWSSSTPASAWPGPVPDGWPSPPLSAEPSESQGSNPFEDQGPKGDRSFGVLVGVICHRMHARHPITTYSYDVYAYGFPFPSLRMDHADESSFAVTPAGYSNMAKQPLRGLEIQPRSTFAWGGFPAYVIPMVPYWRGFIPNIAFWAWMSVLIHRFFRAALTSRRLARGLCPTCRYPIGPTPICSECGMQIPGGLCKPHIDNKPPEP